MSDELEQQDQPEEGAKKGKSVLVIWPGYPQFEVTDYADEGLDLSRPGEADE